MQVVTLYCFHKFNLFELFQLNEQSFIAYLDAVSLAGAYTRPLFSST